MNSVMNFTVQPKRRFESLFAIFYHHYNLHKLKYVRKGHLDVYYIICMCVYIYHLYLYIYNLYVYIYIKFVCVYIQFVCVCIYTIYMCIYTICMCIYTICMCIYTICMFICLIYCQKVRRKMDITPIYCIFNVD